MTHQRTTHRRTMAACMAIALIAFGQISTAQGHCDVPLCRLNGGDTERASPDDMREIAKAVRVRILRYENEDGSATLPEIEYTSDVLLIELLAHSSIAAPAPMASLLAPAQEPAPGITNSTMEETRIPEAEGDGSSPTSPGIRDQILGFKDLVDSMQNEQSNLDRYAAAAEKIRETVDNPLIKDGDKLADIRSALKSANVPSRSTYEEINNTRIDINRVKQKAFDDLDRARMTSARNSIRAIGTGISAITGDPEVARKMGEMLDYEKKFESGLDSAGMIAMGFSAGDYMSTLNGIAGIAGIFGSGKSQKSTREAMAILKEIRKLSDKLDKMQRYNDLMFGTVYEATINGFANIKETLLGIEQFNLKISDVVIKSQLESVDACAYIDRPGLKSPTQCIAALNKDVGPWSDYNLRSGTTLPKGVLPVSRNDIPDSYATRQFPSVIGAMNAPEALEKWNAMRIRGPSIWYSRRCEVEGEACSADSFARALRPKPLEAPSKFLISQERASIDGISSRRVGQLVESSRLAALAAVRSSQDATVGPDSGDLETLRSEVLPSLDHLVSAAIARERLAAGLIDPLTVSRSLDRALRKQPKRVPSGSIEPVQEECSIAKAESSEIRGNASSVAKKPASSREDSSLAIAADDAQRHADSRSHLKQCLFDDPDDVLLCAMYWNPTFASNAVRWLLMARLSSMRPCLPAGEANLCIQLKPAGVRDYDKERATPARAYSRALQWIDDYLLLHEMGGDLALFRDAHSRSGWSVRMPVLPNVVQPTAAPSKENPHPREACYRAYPIPTLAELASADLSPELVALEHSLLVLRTLRAMLEDH